MRSPNYTLANFARFCPTLVLDSGERMVLHEYEATMLREHFEGCREVLILVPKKNGKTTLIAALVLFHMLVTPDCLVVVVASSVKQAGILYRQMRSFARKSGMEHLFTLRDSTKEIRSAVKGDDGLIQVLAADADTADGAIPTLGIVDEMHRAKSAELYTVIRDGLDGRDGQMATISTAGQDETSPLGVIRSRALKFTDLRRDGKHVLAVSDNAQFVMHEWSLDQEDDRSDMAVVKLANPAPWHTEESLAMRHDSPSTTPWGWARFACNVWYAWDESSAVRPELWDACREEGVLLNPTLPVDLGVDLGWKRESDTTAIVPFQWQSETRRVAGRPLILVPQGDGSLLDDRVITDAVLAFTGEQTFHREGFLAMLRGSARPDAAEAWADEIEWASAVNLRSVVFDPTTGGQQLFQQLEREHGVETVAFHQKPTPLARADMQLMEAMRRRALRQDWQPEARNHVLNAVEVPAGSGQVYFGRPKSGPRKPTDALRGLSMVHSVVLAGGGEADPRAKQKRGVAFL